MKKWDYIIISIFILIGIAGCLIMYALNSRGNKVMVYSGGRLYGEYDLSVNQNIEIVNKHGGVNIVNIDNGEVYMSFADCANQICVNQGKIIYSNEAICCVPNGVVVVIQSEDKGEYDAITQ